MKALWIAFCCAAAPLAAEEPWSASRRHPVVPCRRESKAKPGARCLSPPARALRRAVRFYQRRISPYDGPHCQLYPTCSEYSRQCLERHGALVGLVMTVDRLVQEMDVLARAPLIRVYGHIRGFDPVEANDFWWAKRGRRRIPRP